MTMTGGLQTMTADGLGRFSALQPDAVGAVTERFYATHGSAYQRFGPRGRQACREDLAFHLEFLRPVLEFGLLQPMVDYLRWLASVLAARDIPHEHLAQSLDWLGEYYAGHLDPADGQVVAGALEAARTAFLESGAAPDPPTPPEAWAGAAPFEAALLAGRQREALAEVGRCLDDGHSLVAVEMHVIQQALYRIGERWQANQVSVAQEHMATAIARSVMTAGLLRARPPAPNHKKVLLACVEGNNHELGLRMVADAFSLGGWDVHYLGASVPTAALVQQASDWQPDLIGLSVSFPQQLRVVREVIARLPARAGGGRPPVIVGGLAVNRFTRLAGVTGADASGADARSAVAEGHQLVTA